MEREQYYVFLIFTYEILDFDVAISVQCEIGLTLSTPSATIVADAYSAVGDNWHRSSHS